MWSIPAQESVPISFPSADPDRQKKENEELDTLFVYGSLHNDQYLQILTGRSFPARQGELLDHRRVQPRNSFAFAVPWKGSRIKGKLLTGMTPAVLKKLDEYEREGELYHRCVGLCQTDHGTVQAYVYIGDPKALKSYIKRGFSERDRIEEFVQKQVERYLENKADRCLLMDRKHLSLLVTRELLSEEIESILMQHFTEAGLPKFIIKHEIESASLPSLDWITSDPKTSRYAGQYMALAVKFMVFNQLEENFRNDYRGHVQTSDVFYHRTISGLMALKLITDRQSQLHNAMEQLRVNGYSEDLKYPDYAVAAIMIAKELYSRQAADDIVNWLQDHRRPGIQPIGAELEFSDLGRHAIKSAENQDPKYDGFNYFYDFDLMRRGWKLGAHVDDHGFLTTADTRTRGFLELAFGRYKLLGDISKPATMDPWVLAQMIQLAVQFMEIKPHSLHISIQTMPDRNFNKWDDPLHFICLLMLGGDLREDENGSLREMRLFHEEILHPDMGVCFSRLNRHHRHPDDRNWTSVVEFQFPRLRADYDYQPLIMALKGFQTGGNPYPFGGIRDCPFGQSCKELQDSLIQWSFRPTTMPQSSIDSFLSLVGRGLDEEAGQSDPDYKKYALSIMDKIEEQLLNRNRMIAEYNQRDKK
jgi:gamma-glutamylcyclotransferase (GGCT)/AIG2-like uncharacterized protein YtfP